MNVIHPAAKMLVELSRAQDVEAGDGPTSVVVIAGALLDAVNKLLQKGIHPTAISDAFQKCARKAVEILTEMSRPIELNDRESLVKSASTSLNSKVVSQQSSLLAPIAVDAVMKVAEELAEEVDFVARAEEGEVAVVGHKAVEAAVEGPAVEAAVEGPAVEDVAAHEAVGHAAVAVHEAVRHAVVAVHEAVGHAAVGRLVVGPAAVGPEAVGRAAVGHEAVGQAVVRPAVAELVPAVAVLGPAVAELGPALGVLHSHRQTYPRHKTHPSPICLKLIKKIRHHVSHV